MHTEQLEAVIKTLLSDYPVSVIRVIPRTGKYRQSVPWVHLENNLNGSRMATFVSFDSILRAFWRWLETAEVMVMALFQRIAISKVIWQLVEVGDEIFTTKHGYGKVADKDFTESKGIPRFWVMYRDCLDVAMPYEVEIF